MSKFPATSRARPGNSFSLKLDDRSRCSTCAIACGNTAKLDIERGDMPTGAEWYPLDDSRVTAAEGLAEGDAVIYTFTSTSGNVGTIKVEKK